MAKRRPARPRETDLYEPIRDHLEALGYEVRAEVNHCDITARKGDDLIVIELKRQFGTKLLTQAIERQRISGSVYVALPGPAYEGRRRQRDVRRLLRRLELGLILVLPDGREPQVEVVLHPLPFERKRSGAARRGVLSEMAHRPGGYNEGGSAGVKLMTAYRKSAVRIACYLNELGPLSPKQLRDLGTGPKTQSILYSDFYGWFQRVGRGVYAITRQGRAALKEYADLAARYRETLPEAP